MYEKVKDFRAIIMMGACNLRCAYCGNSPFVLDEDKTIESLTKIFKDISCRDTCLRVECRGEITLYNKIIEYLKEKGEEGYTIEILSNGLLIDKVLTPNDKIKTVISLDGHTVNMNRMRRLTQKQVEHLLYTVFKYTAEIQCVYYKQTYEQMNQFIDYLNSRGFKSLLHIFPCSENGRIISYLDLDKLNFASFLPDKIFFQRWKYIFENHKRNFQCDFYKNGYTYYIHNEKMAAVKCDCVPEAVNYLKGYEEPHDTKNFNCGCCINHYEYNNSRNIMKY